MIRYQNPALYLRLADDYEKYMSKAGVKVWRDSGFYEEANDWIEKTCNVNKSDHSDFFFNDMHALDMFLLRWS